MTANIALLSRLQLSYVNQLGEAPADPARVYMVGDKKYGQPKFRVKKRSGGDVLPDSDAFWFNKDDKTKAITLHCIIEVYRPEADVYPLSIKNPQILLEFEAGGRKVQKTMAITQSPLINDINILQDLHAETEIQWEEIKDLITQLKNPDAAATFQLVVTAELWWQGGEPPKPNPNPVIRDAVLNPLILRRVRDHRAAATETAATRIHTLGKFRHMRRLEEVRVARPDVAAPAAREPQKIDLRHTELLRYTKEDEAVFGPLSEEFMVKSYNWQMLSMLKNEGTFIINYRPTARPDEFYFLPQVFRIKAREQNGEPKISVTMLAGADPNKSEGYRINIGITLIPYYHPKAKKDLYMALDKASKGTIKYCNLLLGGFKSAQFRLRDSFTGENAVFTGRIKESIASIDPVNGFVLTVDCSLESFDFFKRQISEGVLIGDIVFELTSEVDGREQVSTQAIPVELDLRKLAGIPVHMEVITETKEEEVDIRGFRLVNPNAFPITVSGSELTLLSEIGDTVYDADYDIRVQKDWPITIPQQAKEEVLLRAEDIAEIGDRFWTELVCEPYSVTLDSDPEAVLARVIDMATGDPQVWVLEISCPLLERWKELDEATLAPFKQVHHVAVEIRNEEGAVFSVKLDLSKPVATLEMARSISQILKSQQLSGRKYQYRVGTVYVVNPTHWTGWLEPESTAANFLSVIPQRLTV